MKVNIELRSDNSYIAYNIDGLGTISGEGDCIQSCKDDFLKTLETERMCYVGHVPECLTEEIVYYLIDENSTSQLRERKIKCIKDYFESQNDSCYDEAIDYATAAYETDGHREWLDMVEFDETDGLTEEEFKKDWIESRAEDMAGDIMGEREYENSFKDLDVKLFADDLAQAAEENPAFKEILQIWREGRHEGGAYICARVADESGAIPVIYSEVSLFWYIVNKYVKM